MGKGGKDYDDDEENEDDCDDNDVDDNCDDDDDCKCKGQTETGSMFRSLSCKSTSQRQQLLGRSRVGRNSNIYISTNSVAILLVLE